jgi:hypothetical protein
VLGFGLEVVERPTRFINVLFMEVHVFSRKQSHILCIVHAKGCVSLHILCTVCVLPLVHLHNLIFEPSTHFFSFLMKFGVVGGLIVAGIDVFIQALCAMLRTIFQ